MSQSFHITCLVCKESLWIGQGWGTVSKIYSGKQKETNHSLDQVTFYNSHLGLSHHLVFHCEQTLPQEEGYRSLEEKYERNGHTEPIELEEEKEADAFVQRMLKTNSMDKLSKCCNAPTGFLHDRPETMQTSEGSVHEGCTSCQRNYSEIDAKIERDSLPTEVIEVIKEFREVDKHFVEMMNDNYFSKDWLMVLGNVDTGENTWTTTHTNSEGEEVRRSYNFFIVPRYEEETKAEKVKSFIGVLLICTFFGFVVALPLFFFLLILFNFV